MDKDTFGKFVKMMQSENDSDAAMGLRGLQNFLREENVDFVRAMTSIFDNISGLKNAVSVESLTQAAAPAARGKVEVSGMPQCQLTEPGIVMIIPAGQIVGEKIVLPGLSAENGQEVADGVKDALVAAVINKSRFKLKLLDIKDKHGDVVETVLQAEYDRDGMQPVRVWGNIKGEVAALATVLRRAVAAALPDLVA